MVTPEHVRRQHVARELQPVEPAVDRPRQRLRQRSLPHARHVFDQQMPAREKTHQRHPHSLGLTANTEFDRCFDFAELTRRNARGERGRE